MGKEGKSNLLLEKKNKIRHLYNQSLLVDKFSKTSTWHSKKKKKKCGENFLDYLSIQALFLYCFPWAGGAPGLHWARHPVQVLHRLTRLTCPLFCGPFPVASAPFRPQMQKRTSKYLFSTITVGDFALLGFIPRVSCDPMEILPNMTQHCPYQDPHLILFQRGHL